MARIIEAVIAMDGFHQILIAGLITVLILFKNDNLVIKDLFISVKEIIETTKFKSAKVIWELVVEKV